VVGALSITMILMIIRPTMILGQMLFNVWAM